MRGRGVVLGVVLGAASSLVVDGVADAAGSSAAAAADGAVAVGTIPLEAPVGIVAVAFGVVGLVAGLVRRRKAALLRAATEETEVRPATTGI